MADQLTSLAPDLVGIAEIAERAGVRPDTVAKWRIRHPGFPPPLAQLAAGPVWDWPAVDGWIAARKGPGRPPRAAVAAS